MSKPTDSVQKTVLVVGRENFDRSVFSANGLLSMEYSFVDSYPNDGFSAWRTDTAAIADRVQVASTCRKYTGGFSQQALNRFFAEALIAHRVATVVVVGLTGCTVDLPRVAALMGIPAVLILDEPVEDPSSLNPATEHWIRDSLAKCQFVIPVDSQTATQWPSSWMASACWGSYPQLKALLDEPLCSAANYSFDYSTYEFCQRDHPLLKTMQHGDTTHFAGCERVLDIGCGVGIFLDCLRQQGLEAVGVERDRTTVDYAQGMGLNVISADALDFLQQTNDLFDGIYCSHFVEHLPIEAVQRLIDLLALRLKPGGVLVLTFPDPESIRSQLLGFWRDPEHVRFYHPTLIGSLAISAGLELEWTSYDAQPHQVVPFAEQPPPVSDIEASLAMPATAGQLAPSGWLESILSRLGFVSRRQLQLLEQNLQQWGAGVQDVLEQQGQVNAQLRQRTDSLWDVNKTWAWNDNATLKLRKRAGQRVE